MLNDYKENMNEINVTIPQPSQWVASQNYYIFSSLLKLQANACLVKLVQFRNSHGFYKFYGHVLKFRGTEVLITF